MTFIILSDFSRTRLYLYILLKSDQKSKKSCYKKWWQRNVMTFVVCFLLSRHFFSRFKSKNNCIDFLFFIVCVFFVEIIRKLFTQMNNLSSYIWRKIKNKTNFKCVDIWDENTLLNWGLSVLRCLCKYRQSINVNILRYNDKEKSEKLRKC